MTDKEVDARFTVLAVMLAAPSLAMEFDSPPPADQRDIQLILWEDGYLPARKMLLDEGATLVQVEEAFSAKLMLFASVPGMSFKAG